VKHEWSVRVRTDSTKVPTATARNHSWQVGEPLTFAPKDDRPSALELAVGALAADLVGGLQRICRVRRIDFDQAEMSMRWTLDNPLTYVGVIGEEGSPAIAQIDGVLYVSSSDEEAVQDAWKVALARSPLFNTFNKATVVSLRLTVTP